MADDKFEKRAARIKEIYAAFSVKMDALRERQKGIIATFRKKAEEKKIAQIKKDLGIE